jgi:hypothetical protein
MMRVFRRPPSATATAGPEPGADPPTCRRCRQLLPRDGRAVKAWSIVDATEPALFHLDCAPASDDLRWYGHREMPVRTVREPDAK